MTNKAQQRAVEILGEIGGLESEIRDWERHPYDQLRFPFRPIPHKAFKKFKNACITFLKWKVAELKKEFAAL